MNKHSQGVQTINARHVPKI